MKKHYINTSQPTERQNTAKRQSKCPDHLDRVAEELLQLAKKRLPNNVLQGDLTGLEEDIRQDAVILCLSWYLRQNREFPQVLNYLWLPPRAIAAALKIQKRDYLKSISRRLETLQQMSNKPEVILDHPTRLRTCDWSSFTMQTVLRKAIRIALKDERISLANAAIGLELLVNGVTAKQLAKRRHVSSSAIYQHLSRVRREIPDIINGIEVPLHELL